MFERLPIFFSLQLKCSINTAPPTYLYSTHLCLDKVLRSTRFHFTGSKKTLFSVKDTPFLESSIISLLLVPPSVTVLPWWQNSSTRYYFIPLNVVLVVVISDTPYVLQFLRQFFVLSFIYFILIGLLDVESFTKHWFPTF